MYKTTVKQSKNFKTTSLPIKPTLSSQTIHSSFFRLSDFLHKTRLVFSQQQQKTLAITPGLEPIFSHSERIIALFLTRGKSCIRLFRVPTLKNLTFTPFKTTTIGNCNKLQCGTTMSQSELTAHTTKERESAHVRVSLVIFGLASHWFKKWGDILCQPMRAEITVA